MSAATPYFPPIAKRPTVLTPPLKAFVDRGLTYLRSGLPVNLTGAAGTGKTTLALHMAHLLQRPAIFIQGDDQLSSTELVRGGINLRRHRVVDNYIRSVVRTEDHYTENWSENWLTTACEKGYTLVYDEFTRSRPEANNVLLSVLEERVLVSSGVKDDLHIMAVHPEFRVIFTSNPVDYVGVHKSPDALRDRMVSMMLQPLDEDTETVIVRAHSGLAEDDCRRVVRVVRAVRARSKGSTHASLRSAVNLAKVLAHARLKPDFSNPTVIGFCHDLLGSSSAMPPEVLGEVLSGFGRPQTGRENAHAGKTPEN